MQTFIALLRGINVGGHNRIKMVDLKQLLQNLGYKNIATYIQSGNIVFQSNEIKTATFEDEILKTINEHFGYTIKVIVLTKNELETVFNSNPFLKIAEDNTKGLYVTFLKNKPETDAIKQFSKVALTNNDVYKIIDKSIYLYCPKSYGNTKLSNNLFEKKLKTEATSRNWKTITKLIELSNYQIE